MRSLADQLNERDHDRMHAIVRLTQRMDELLNSLLQYSRAGRSDLAMLPVDLNAVVGQLLGMLRPQLDAAGVEVRIPRPLPVVRGDRVSIHEIFQNLIVNAMKYNNKPERWIEVGYEEGERTAYYVRDNGIGIESRHHELIFKIFKRLHTQEQFGGGSGAGLTISKKLVERHGGRMWLTSIPGQGSTFFFTLEPMKGDELVSRTVERAPGDR